MTKDDDRMHDHHGIHGEHALRMSQLGNERCLTMDTDEMKELRQHPDASSLLRLGSLLIARYRYKDAIDVLERASEAEPDSAEIQMKLGGTKLTLLRCDEAMHHYFKALELDAPEQPVYFACAVAAYFRGDYIRSAELFEKYKGEDGESLISSIYWNTLNCCRAGIAQRMLMEFDPDMDSGYHDAYKETMLVFAGYTDPSDISFGQSELDDAIIQYGLSVYYESVGDKETAGRMLRLAADHEEVWPCISCLAAWKDLKRV